MPPYNQDKLKKVILWVKEKREEKPSLSLADAFRKAQVNFDLSPKECNFLERNFTQHN